MGGVWHDSAHNWGLTMPNMGKDGAEDGTYTVTVRLRTKTEMEKAIDELKAGHEANAEAIQELASIATESEV